MTEDNTFTTDTPLETLFSLFNEQADFLLLFSDANLAGDLVSSIKAHDKMLAIQREIDFVQTVVINQRVQRKRAERDV